MPCLSGHVRFQSDKFTSRKVTRIAQGNYVYFLRICTTVLTLSSYEKTVQKNFGNSVIIFFTFNFSLCVIKVRLTTKYVIEFRVL